MNPFLFCGDKRETVSNCQREKPLPLTGCSFVYLRRAPRRRKLRIARLRASARARSLRCSAFPHATRLCWARAGTPILLSPRLPQALRRSLFRVPPRFGSAPTALQYAPTQRQRSKDAGPYDYGIPTLRNASAGNTAGKHEVPHRRLSLYGSLKPFLSFHKRKERNGFKTLLLARQKRKSGVGKRSYAISS